MWPSHRHERLYNRGKLRDTTPSEETKKTYLSTSFESLQSIYIMNISDLMARCRIFAIKSLRDDKSLISIIESFVAICLETSVRSLRS